MQITPHLPITEEKNLQDQRYKKAAIGQLNSVVRANNAAAAQTCTYRDSNTATTIGEAKAHEKCSWDMWSGRSAAKTCKRSAPVSVSS